MRKLVAGVVIWIVFFSLVYSFMPSTFIEDVVKIPVPRLRSMQVLPGTAELWQVIYNKFKVDLNETLYIFSIFIPVLFSTMGYLITLLLAWLIPRLFKCVSGVPSPDSRGLIFLILAGFALSPTVWLGGGYHRYDCEADVLAADQHASLALQTEIRVPAQIFWRGVSPVTLLHVPEAGIYPPQLNGDYSYRLSGEPDELLRYGWWNQSLGLKWVKEADYVLVAPKYIKEWLSEALESGEYHEILIYPDTTEQEQSGCLEGIYPRVYKKNP